MLIVIVAFVGGMAFEYFVFHKLEDKIKKKYVEYKNKIKNRF